MSDNSVTITIDIGITDCRIICFSCLNVTTLGAHKFVMARQIFPQDNIDLDIDVL